MAGVIDARSANQRSHHRAIRLTLPLGQNRPRARHALVHARERIQVPDR